jgi:hypothetical protein
MREAVPSQIKKEITIMKKIAIKFDSITGYDSQKVRISKSILSKVENELKEMGFPYGRMYPAMVCKKALAEIGVSCEMGFCPVTGRKFAPVLYGGKKGWYRIICG